MAVQVLNILLVEDHVSTNETLTKMLRRKGHVVASATNAAAALKLTEQGQVFDLLLSDIGLPDSTGWDLLIKLRAKQPRLPAIAVTGYGFPNDMKRSTEIGFDMHLTKPIDWGAILQAIGSLFPETIEKPH